MKKEEKTKRTHEKIIAAAIEEFGTNSYDQASLTTLCRNNHISKGLLYHNFKSKDELYLQCVTIAFQQLIEYLKANQDDNDTVQGLLHNILQKRHQFFKEYPFYGNIFFNALLQPPSHLHSQIHQIRCAFDEYSLNCYKNLLNKIELRKGITSEMAMQYFLVFQEMFNSYFQSKSFASSNYHELIKDHETNLSKFLDIMLYGIAVDSKKN